MRLVGVRKTVSYLCAHTYYVLAHFPQLRTLLSDTNPVSPYAQGRQVRFAYASCYPSPANTINQFFFLPELLAKLKAWIP